MQLSLHMPGQNWLLFTIRIGTAYQTTGRDTLLLFCHSGARYARKGHRIRTVATFTPLPTACRCLRPAVTICKSLYVDYRSCAYLLIWRDLLTH